MAFRIGHPKDTGVNRADYAQIKSEAVNILRNRGAKRNEARSAVAESERTGLTTTVVAGELGQGIVEILFSGTGVYVTLAKAKPVERLHIVVHPTLESGPIPVVDSSIEDIAQYESSVLGIHVCC